MFEKNNSKTNLISTNLNKNGGFTLVELLLSIAILAILSGVTASVINVTTQKGRANDAVIRKDMEHVSQAIESYIAGENALPAPDPRGRGNPVGNGLNTYITSWPTGFVYIVGGGMAANVNDFCIYKTLSNGSYLKYCSSWGSIKNCANNAGVTNMDICTEL